MLTDNVNCWPMGDKKGMLFSRSGMFAVGSELGSSLPYLNARGGRVNTRTAWHAVHTLGKISPNVGDDKQPSLVCIDFLLWPLFLRALSLPVESRTFVFVCSSLVLECNQDRLLSLIR
jgi:hypothetical protein